MLEIRVEIKLSKIAVDCYMKNTEKKVFQLIKQLTGNLLLSHRIFNSRLRDLTIEQFYSNRRF